METNFLRTPESRFDDLHDYSFKANYLNLNGLRMHYLDVGDGDQVILLLHGQPTWSYIYRHIIKTLADTGIRVIAPDLIGFGKSDKPVERGYHILKTHVNNINALVKVLKLKQFNMFVHDWGCMIGLRLVTEIPDQINRLIISNGYLLTGNERQGIGLNFYHSMMKIVRRPPIPLLMKLGTRRSLLKHEIKAYQAPFPGKQYEVAPLAFPRMIPVNLRNEASQDNLAAWNSLNHWDKPVMTVLGKYDLLTRGAQKVLIESIPGAKHSFHCQLKAGHFIQEDQPQRLSEIIHKFIVDQ